MTTLTALVNVDDLAVDDWLALWQRLGTPGTLQGFRLMARHVLQGEAPASSYVFMSYARPELPSAILRVNADGTDYKPRFFVPSEGRALALAVNGPWLFFILERAEDEALCRVKVDDGTGFTVVETKEPGYWSHGPDAIYPEGEGVSVATAAGKISHVYDGTTYSYYLDDVNPTTIWRAHPPKDEEATIFKELESYPEGEGGEGLLTERELVEGIEGIEALCMSPNGQHVYAVVNFSNQVWQFHRDSVTGALTPLEPATVEMSTERPEDIHISPDGRYVYVTAFEPTAPGGIATFSRDDTTGQLTFVAFNHYGLEAAVDMTISANGRSAYVTGYDLSANRVLAQYDRDPATGKLTPLSPAFAVTLPEETEGEWSAVQITLDGEGLYAIENDRIYQLSRDVETGVLTAVGAGYVSLPVGAEGGSLASSPDGQNLYVAARPPLGSEAAIYQYRRIKATGALSRLEPYFVEAPTFFNRYAVMVSHDGHNLYRSGKEEVLQFLRDPVSGQLTPLEPPTASATTQLNTFTRYMAESPDGRSLYLVGLSADIIVMTRDPFTPPPFTLDKGMAYSQGYIYFSGVGPFGRNIGRIREDGAEFAEEWHIKGALPPHARGPLAVDDKYLYYANAGVIGRVPLLGGAPQDKYIPAPAAGSEAFGMTTAPKPGVGIGGLELRLERRRGGTSLLAVNKVDLGSGLRELAFVAEDATVEIGGTQVAGNLIEILLDGEPLIAGFAAGLIGGYVGIEGNHGHLRKLEADAVLLDPLERLETPLGGANWGPLDQAIDMGEVTGIGWQPTSADSGAVWNQFYGEEPPVKEKGEEPEGEPEQPVSSSAAGGGGVVPFSRP